MLEQIQFIYHFHHQIFVKVSLLSYQINVKLHLIQLLVLRLISAIHYAEKALVMHHLVVLGLDARAQITD